MNALFKQIYDSVVQGRTNRPALVLETKNAVQEATMELHSAAKFMADLQLMNVVLGSSASRSKFTLSAPVRSVYTVTALTDDNQRVPLRRSTLATTNRWETNWFRQFGKEFEIQTTEPVRAYEFQYFGYPDLAEGNYDSWIAKMYPFAVADLAAAKIFALVEPKMATFFLSRVGNPALVSSHIGRIIQENPHAVD